MQFNSLKFAAFFPVVTVVYFLLPQRFRNAWLLAASYLFYMCWNPKYALLMLASTAITWGCAMLMARCSVQKTRRWLMAVALVANFGILFLFKYAGFALDNINAVRAALGLDAVMQGFQVLLPVGISFYIFQAVGYTIDVYRGDEPEKNFFIYALFISFFPQLVAGPIERSRNMLPQFRQKHTLEYQRLKSGLIQMLFGFIEKMVIADRVALLVDAVYADPTAFGTMPLLLAVLFFPFQIYCDFSSYSNIAIGCARILGFDLMKNFDSPYLARTVGEYWQRWHISLTTWLGDYLYKPLGGSRHGMAKTCRNTLIVFLASGLWHGAAWTYVLVGLLHGVWISLSRITYPTRKALCQRLGIDRQSAPHQLVQWAITFVFLCFAFIIFRSTSVAQIGQVLSGLLPWQPGPWGTGDCASLGMDAQDFVVSCLAIAALIVCDILRRRYGPLTARLMEKPLAVQWGVLLCGLLILTVFGMYGQGYTERPFIYFQF